jgi:hypothetical protein
VLTSPPACGRGRGWGRVNSPPACGRGWGWARYLPLACPRAQGRGGYRGQGSVSGLGLGAKTPLPSGRGWGWAHDARLLHRPAGNKSVAPQTALNPCPGAGRGRGTAERPGRAGPRQGHRRWGGRTRTLTGCEYDLKSDCDHFERYIGGVLT